MIEFYGVNGKWPTLAKASNYKVFPTWACVACMFCMFTVTSIITYLHCDIKGDNYILIQSYDEGSYSSVFIDFGKMIKTSEAKMYKLV